MTKMTKEKEKVEIIQEVVNRNKLKNEREDIDEIVSFLLSVGIEVEYNYR